LAGQGSRVKTMATLEGLEKSDPSKTLLIIGPRTLSDDKAGDQGAVIGRSNPGQDSLRSYMVRGGRVLFLEQDTYTGLGLGVDLTTHPSTYTFMLDGKDPLFKGLKPEDLSLWTPGHYVTRKEFRRPVCGGATAHAVSGGERGLDQSPILETRLGEGRAVMLQCLVGEKYTSDPAARKLMQNALDLLAQPAPRPARAVVV